MMTGRISQITLILLLILFLSSANQKVVTIWMIGDSTMAYKKPERNPESGWGVALSQLVNNKAIVKNRAASGRSTKSFIAEKRWKSVLDSIQPGDYVIIQFGHNDQKQDSLLHTDAGTSFKKYLSQFINESKLKGANPVICTSIVRRHFDGNGNLIDTHGNYLNSVRELAEETKTPFVDMEKLTRKLVKDMGPEKSKELFTMRKNGLDSTHLCYNGAQQVARLFVSEAKKKHLKIRQYLK
jgi:lysophospholipase L1-like esterase